MVDQSAIAQWTKAKSDSCLPYLTNSTQIGNRTSSFRANGEFVWSPKTQGYILGSYFVGYVVVQMPAGRLVERFGAKRFLLATTLIPSVATVLFPAFSWVGASAVIFLQLLRGSAQGFSTPALSVLLANWFTRVDRGLLFAIIMSGGSMGRFLGSLFSGLLCDSAGRWPSSFYAIGAFGLLLCILIWFLVYENAEVHPRISKAEQDYIISNQETKLFTKRPRPPYGKIFTSAPVYAMMFAVFGQLWALSQFLIMHATFLETILHYAISENGFLISITFLLQFASAQLSAWIGSLIIKKKIASITFTRKFMNFVACLGYSACLFGVYCAGCNRTLSIIFGILATSFTGFGYAGCLVVSAEMSSMFAGMLCALTTTTGTIACVVFPLIVGYITDEMQTLEQWSKVFFLSIGVVMSSGIVFAIFGSADVQPWNTLEKDVGDKENEKQTRF